jgi:Uma2 family endonuclease
MTTQTTYVTSDEYLAAERLSEHRSEYLDGVVREKPGGTIWHTHITVNLGTELRLQLRERPCDVLMFDLKVRVPDSSKFLYPDLTVLCGEPQFHDDCKDVILNPDLVVEVLSESSEAYDRGTKFQAYQTFESLKEYLLVAQDQPVIEQYVRRTDGKWNYKTYHGLEASLPLPSIECTLNLSAVYDKVEFNS